MRTVEFKFIKPPFQFCHIGFTKNDTPSRVERGMIIGLHKGTSDISRILEILRETCRDVIKRYCEEGLTESAPRSGRPPLLTDREERTLIRTVREDRQESLQQLTAKFNDLGLTTISASTARRVLHKHEYFGRVGTRKPFVSEDNRKKRLKWSRKHIHWDEEWNTQSFEVMNLDFFCLKVMVRDGFGVNLTRNMI